MAEWTFRPASSALQLPHLASKNLPVGSEFVDQATRLIDAYAMPPGEMLSLIILPSARFLSLASCFVLSSVMMWFRPGILIADQARRRSVKFVCLRMVAHLPRDLRNSPCPGSCATSTGCGKSWHEYTTGDCSEGVTAEPYRAPRGWTPQRPG